MKIIATADWHLRKKVPACRTETEEEWIDYQFKIVDFILDQAIENNAVLCIAGDLFHRSVPSTIILHKTISAFKKFIGSGGGLYIIPGNHDLPYHNLSLLNQSGYGILQEALPFFHSDKIGRQPFGTDYKLNNEIVLCHYLVFQAKNCPPNIDAYISQDICEMFPDSKYIICGDNHTGFIDKIGDQILLVPGAITIQSASCIGLTPSVYFIDDKITPIELPNDKSKLNIGYLERMKERDNRVDDFIDSLASGKKVSLSFKDNLKKAMLQKSVSQDVKNIITELMEEI